MEQIAITLEKLRAEYAPALPFGANQMERIADTFEKEAPRLVDELARFVDSVEGLSKEYKADSVDKLIGEAVGFFNNLSEQKDGNEVSD
jgi:hypothetical protein